MFFFSFFPRACERRVLPIGGSAIYFHIFISAHIIFSSSHLHICTSAHLMFSSSHLSILTSSHLLICTSHLHICTSHGLIFHIFSSSHLQISFSHLRIFTSLIFPPRSLSLSLSLSPCLFLPCLLFIFFLWAGGGANEAPRNVTLSHEIRFDRQKTAVKLRVAK